MRKDPIRPWCGGAAITTAASLLVASAAAAPAADERIETGRDLATRMCAVCHMNPGQGEKSGPMGVPSFTAIANRRAEDHARIVEWLRSRPAIMPDHNVTWAEADALAAFIMSLREAR
jgi:cytochrome c